MSTLNSPIFQTRKLRLRFNNSPVVDTQDRSEPPLRPRSRSRGASVRSISASHFPPSAPLILRTPSLPQTLRQFNVTAWELCPSQKCPSLFRAPVQSR